MVLVANLWQATPHGKQRRTPPRKEKAKKESSSHHGSESARFALGSTATTAAEDLSWSRSWIFQFQNFSISLAAYRLLEAICSFLNQLGQAFIAVSTTCSNSRWLTPLAASTAIPCATVTT
jgi:hypothetical protein